MPHTKHIADDQPQEAETAPIAFNIPNDLHLLITTPGCIYAWDSEGIHAIFTSSRRGIVAAREAKDGSGVLAVADKHVVVLHDTRRATQQSWGLEAGEDEVRQLEYAQDANWLYLSTNLTSTIQRYSIQQEKLSTQVQTHVSPPIALAVSPTGHLLVSASDHPPVVYLKSLTHNSMPILLEPRASSAAVCTASFHPERPNVFLLGFRDGTLASYDATKISRENHGFDSNEDIMLDGEIARFTNLHRTTSKTANKNGTGTKMASITGAAFLLGYKTRAISIGSDGRCRLVDFADGGIILRSWHAKAPLTSVSVTPIRSLIQDKAGKSNSIKIRSLPNTDNLIAISRIDGKVLIYDSVGILLQQKTVSSHGDKVIGVEWVRGPSPLPITARVPNFGIPSTPAAPLQKDSPGQLQKPKQFDSTVPAKSARRRAETLKTGLGLPPVLRHPGLPITRPSPRSDRRFTVHPDEADSTVRYTPQSKRVFDRTIETSKLMDLFSPMKPTGDDQEQHPAAKRLASPRIRPRLSSQTFSSPGQHALGEIDMPVDSHATTSGSSTARPPTGKKKKTVYVRGASTHASPPRQRHNTSKSFQNANTTQPEVEDMASNENAKLLANLCKLRGPTAGPHQGSILAPFAGSKTNKVKVNDSIQQGPIQPSARRKGRQGLAKQKAWYPGNVLERETTWVTDSEQDVCSDEDDEDIWITDQSDTKRKPLVRPRLAPFGRTSARQTSRSGVISRGTTKTARTIGRSEIAVSMPIRNFDGSTTDENFNTARSQISPSGTFSPSSAHIRQLFPRESSLSPSRSGRHRDKQSGMSKTAGTALQEVAGNSWGRHVVKSPWAKAKALKQAQSPNHCREQKVETRAGLPKSPSVHCFTCAESKIKVMRLENEVARLKGEVLALKADLRRHGIQLPITLRTFR
ncbi:hypothetical protein M433DRAFT_152867 [Acidomyces richmondensis BFW]|nr:MAG: hypothetical protein FE78DRAFT_88398 [Acidomyces sp. 'richmondensis']KYG46885.1 hypothetical protein M433DRAFT_152867 [Acidomyces richmondensis BFW]